MPVTDVDVAALESPSLKIFWRASAVALERAASEAAPPPDADDTGVAQFAHNPDGTAVVKGRCAVVVVVACKTLSRSPITLTTSVITAFNLETVVST